MSGDVLVVGGGVVGLTTAVVLAESGRGVHMWTREPAEETTSAVAGALWWPYRIEPQELVGDWSLASLRVYEKLAARPEETGVRLVAGIHADVRPADLGPWATQVGGLREAEADELPDGYAGGPWARIPLIDMPVHRGWLRRRFEAAGGTVELRTVNSFAQAAKRARVVVNCTGLGARELALDDQLRPVRGQLVLVENPGIEEWFTAADHASATTTYFFPQPGRLILGGTAEDDDWRLTPDPATAEQIVARCARIRPEIAGARILGHRAALRPARPQGVRIEAEPLPGGGVLVHNYGHGGAGVTVAWGCAQAAARLVRRADPAP
ncbi:FAD-binding oxidoreductase [Streptomyces sp. ISL-1]|uniref:NAD(P)/FAD-dependent oxidoreductase n=1 Tax=Streptomyces sp. ISL-1 TaxID=2817657 RepID=UPI001BE6F1C5|nr:FAD-dependent oxidoreductase [Streptomyces sp. ISL-1]MBT2392432.1 FAD-binding oxidoreductase [Streptomyces sp. ISL-1]